MKIRPAPRASLSDPAELLGREDLARELSQVGRAQQHVQINGPRRIGKTWLLRWLELTLRAESVERRHVVSVPLELMGEATPARFFKVLAGAFSRSCPSLAARCALGADEPCKDSEALHELALDLEEKGSRLVLLFDEFEKLAAREAFDVGFFEQLRAWFTISSISAVIVSSLPLREVCHPGVAGSTLWGIFRKVTVPGWTAQACGAALKEWLELDSPPPDPVAREAHRLTGGWPLAMAELAVALQRHAPVDLSARAGLGMGLEAHLEEQLEDEIRHMVGRALDRCPGVERTLERLAAADGRLSTHGVPRDALDALQRTGLATVDGEVVQFAWPFTLSVLRRIRALDRTRAFTAESPPSWDEWRSLVGSSCALPVGMTKRLQEAYRAVEQAKIPRDAWFHCRELTDALLTWMEESIPPVEIHSDREPRPFVTRKGRGPRLAHLREASKLPESEPPTGFDPALGRMLEALSHAEQFGAHHQGHDVTPAESAAFLLLARTTLARAAAWRNAWQTKVGAGQRRDR